MSNTTEVKTTESTINNENEQANPNARTVEEVSETTSSSEKSEEATVSTETNASSEGNTETTTTAEVQTAEKTGMSVPFIGLSILQCVIAFMLIIVVLQQSKSASSITSSAIVGGSSDSYWNKNKGRSKEGKLAKITIGLSVIFFIVTISLGFIK